MFKILQLPTYEQLTELSYISVMNRYTKYFKGKKYQNAIEENNKTIVDIMTKYNILKNEN